MYAFPRRSVGTRRQERGNEKMVSVMYAFPRRSVGTRKTVSVMYAFPRRSVGTRRQERGNEKNGQRNVCIPTQERGNEKNGQRNVCIPTQERGNEKTVSVMMKHSHGRSVGTRNGQRNMHSHAGAWEREIANLRSARHQNNVCIPTQERGNEKTVSVMYALYAFPRRSVGTRNGQRNMHSHAGAWEREMVSVICIPTQERGNEKWSA